MADKIIPFAKPDTLMLGPDDYALVLRSYPDGGSATELILPTSLKEMPLDSVAPAQLLILSFVEESFHVDTAAFLLHKAILEYFQKSTPTNDDNPPSIN